MLEGYLTLGGVEIANHARLQAYIDAGLVGGWDHLEACGCPTLTAASLGEAPYVSPSADPAPWYDANIAASGEFSGLLLLGVSGIDDRPTSRAVSQSVTGGGGFGRQRIAPRTMVCSGVLLGQTCCGVAYGLRWLGQALDGCATPTCDGGDMEVFDCCPSEELSSVQMATHLRTLRRVALTQGPTVTRRAGEGCQGGCTADVLFVEFILTAAQPWLWTPLDQVASESVPTDDGTACIEWTAVATGCEETGPCCHNASCSVHSGCSDPACITATPPEVRRPVSCACLPLATNRTCVEIDTSGFGAITELVPVITVQAGTSDLRRLLLSFYELPEGSTAACCEATTQDIDYDEATVDYDDADVYYDGEVPAVVDIERCDRHSFYLVGYVGAGQTLVLDGTIARATVDCDGASEPSPDVWGADGAPLSFPPLGCGRTYCLAIEADALFTPADDATVTIELAGRE